MSSCLGHVCENRSKFSLEHVYMISEVNLKQFEIPNYFEKFFRLHDNFRRSETHFGHSHKKRSVSCDYASVHISLRSNWPNWHFKLQWVFHVNSKYPQWNKVAQNHLVDNYCTCALLLLLRRHLLTQHLLCIN